MDSLDGGGEIRRMKSNRLVSIAGKMILHAACALLLAGAHAGPITISFSGIVTQVPIDDLYMDIGAGDQIFGNYTFESSATDLIPGDPESGSYLSVGPPYGMTVTISGHVFNAFDSLNIGILNSFVDQYTITAVGAGGSLVLEFLLQDNSGSVFSDDSLPLAPPQPALMTILDFHLHEVADPGETQVDGQITSFDAVSEIPEPATSLLALISMAGLMAAANFKRRN